MILNTCSHIGNNILLKKIHLLVRRERFSALFVTFVRGKLFIRGGVYVYCILVLNQTVATLFMKKIERGLIFLLD